MRPSSLSALCLAAVTAAGLAMTNGIAPQATAAPADDHVTTGGFRPKPVDWQPCRERPNDPTVRCATLQVPIDWAHPDGPTFGLAVAKQAASGPSKGPLVINPGGPGGSGVDYALEAKQAFSPKVLQNFDIIGFDPRGVGRSHPVECSAGLMGDMPKVPVPGSPAEYDKLLAFNHKLGADCRAHTGPLYDHVDTLSVDKDIDAIRAALGAHQISYYGVSYGTLIGQEYAEQFPQRVRAMVVDSNMDHSLNTLPFLLTEAGTDEDAFNEFAKWCDRDSSCALHGKDVPKLWDDLMRRADAGKLLDPTSGEPISWWDLVSGAVNSFYGPNWSELAAELSAMNDEGAPAKTFSDITAPNPTTVFCEDWNLPVSGYQEMRGDFEASKRVAPHLRTSSLGWGVAASCLNSGAPVNNPQHRLDVHTSTPLLVLNSMHDPATPYAWAVDDAGQLGAHGRLVTYQGWGHGAYRHSDCTTNTVDSYLVDGKVPDVGTTCAAVPPPDEDSLRTGPTAPVPHLLPWSR